MMEPKLTVAWNTGALYTKEGQQIAAALFDTHIVFIDASRGIEGAIPITPALYVSDAYKLRELTMHNYNFGNYGWTHNIGLSREDIHQLYELAATAKLPGRV